MTDIAQRRPTSVQDLKDLLGVTLGPTQWHTVDQAKIDAFAELTGDHQWIHVDPERAADSPFGSTIAHGLYSLSRTPAFLEELMAFDGFAHSLNYGYDRVRFIHPLPVGSRIRLHAELTKVEETKPGQVNVVTTLTVEAEGIDKPILVAESIGRFSA
ncbi:MULTISPECIES: MaoC family dehydratase [Janibacter]|uniref:Enoyl-CoA hydratase n=1 Tax=Janibacter melonis TaxID=262209 RepID=A0A176Q9L8_9MICO|nr:MaoC family dehydratase [Janibacter melonis]MBD5829289.1 MaoC family dehydratase [Janibacter melonis]MCB5991116.1 MaoC family dehydratase [Janibacter melonis]MCM3553986.1 MaoC family dehydratase [Janibacter melonis]OAB86362.1 enoyl-CoA hydratase [Janibacter melonis]QFQ30906.1 MaoC family dehydratase [Janibacter melonis]